MIIYVQNLEELRVLLSLVGDDTSRKILGGSCEVRVKNNINQ